MRKISILLCCVCLFAYPIQIKANDYQWKPSGSSWIYTDGQQIKKGWFQVDGKWYYGNEKNGELAKEWLNIDNDFYYFDPQTYALLSDESRTIDDITYYFNKEGKLTLNQEEQKNYDIYLDGLQVLQDKKSFKCVQTIINDTTLANQKNKITIQNIITVKDKAYSIKTISDDITNETYFDGEYLITNQNKVKMSQEESEEYLEAKMEILPKLLFVGSHSKQQDGKTVIHFNNFSTIYNGTLSTMTRFLNTLISDGNFNFNTAKQPNHFYAVIDENNQLSEMKIEIAVEMKLNQENAAIHVDMNTLYE